MKKTVLNMAILLCTGLLVSCGSSGTKEESKIEDTNTTIQAVSPEPTPVAQTEKQKIPTCYIKKGTPLTDSMITVHVRCKNGNIPIDEATVTLDGTVKDVAYKGVYFSDYIGFRNLQPDTSYKATLEVLVGGKTIKKSVKIKTREEKVLVTPTPTPTPIVDTPPSNNPPKWTKDSYELFLRSINIPSDNTILDLNKLCSAKGNIIYKVISSGFQQNTQQTDVDYNFRRELMIDSGKLKLNKMPFNGGIGIVEIRATSKNKSSDTSVKITFEPLFLP